MDSFFTAEFFTQNRESLRRGLNNDVPVIITANGQMQRSGDSPFAFAQDSNFWYLTGLDEPDLVLVMLPAETFLITPVLSAEKQAFDGTHDLDAIKRRSGIGQVMGEHDGWQRVWEIVASGSSVATLASPPAYWPRHRLHTPPYRRRLIAKLKRCNKQLESTDVRPLLARLRSIKQPEELRALQRAIDITCDTLSDVAMPKTLQSARHEYELEAAITHGFRGRGAAGHAFEPIVGAGKDGTTLHFVANNNPIAKGDLIVLDVGASVEHYAADVTRTVCSEPMSKRQAEVFQAVAAVQDYALGLLKPGTLLREYEKAVVGRMGQALQQLGLISEISNEATRRYYPHSTSHFLGLDVHDVGDYQAPLEPGMVLTCEPGIYIPEEGIGVRIEDDVLITKDGCKVLSAACPRELARVE